MTVERALAEKGISVEVYDYPLMRKEIEVVIDTSKHDEEVRADERAKVIEELKPFFDEVASYPLDWICDDLCGEFINPINNECWCAEHCDNGTGYECIKKWCELKRKS